MSSCWRKSALRLGSVFGVILSVVFAMHCPQMRAQTSNAQVSGVITDSTGAVVAGAQIRAVNIATNVPYNSVSNGSGIYVLSELLPGPYKITVSAPGFGTVARSGLTLNTGDHLAQNFTLKLGTVEVSVTVTGGQTLISS
ncbi:MAG: carboxypeptidase-like regulatory domain-containing protein, partial [Terracidiphilus sp.]